MNTVVRNLCQQGNLIRVLGLILFNCFLPGAVYANSSTSNVGGAVVQSGTANFEARLGFSEDDDNDSDDNRFRMRQHLDYGFNDWYAFRLLLSQDETAGDNLEHQSVGFENRFQLFNAEEHGFNGGFRIIYSQSDGDKTPNSFNFRVIGEKMVTQQLEFVHNSFLIHEIGADAVGGIKLQLRNRLLYHTSYRGEIIDDIRIGVDFYNDFDRLNDLNGYENQNHQIGPAARLVFDNKYLQIGYRKGISANAIEDNFSLFLGVNF